LATTVGRAAIEAERAGKHYRLVEPENRLVARQLREWEDKLAAQQQLQEDYQRFCAQQPRQLSADERAAIRQLHEIPALWEAPTTTHAQRKEIVRQLVNRIIVQVHGQSEQVTLTIGGQGSMSQHQATRLPNWNNLVITLSCVSGFALATGLNATEIANQLNQEGFHHQNTALGLSLQAC